MIHSERIVQTVTEQASTMKDYLVEVSRGNVTGQSMVHKFGRNDGVPNAAWEVVNQLGSTWPLLSAATTVRIKSGGNAADTAAGAGAREVTVQGIDDSLNEVSETIATAGASASSATTTSFWRVHRAWVSSVGTYGAGNTADIVIENSGGGTDLIQITAVEGQSQFAGWTVPTGKTAYLTSVHITVDSTKPADFRCFTLEDFNDTSAPMKSKRIKLFWDGIGAEFTFFPKGPELKLEALTDIWFEAQGGAAGSEVSIDFELLVIDD